MSTDFTEPTRLWGWSIIAAFLAVFWVGVGWLFWKVIGINLNDIVYNEVVQGVIGVTIALVLGCSLFSKR